MSIEDISSAFEAHPPADKSTKGKVRKSKVRLCGHRTHPPVLLLKKKDGILRFQIPKVIVTINS